MANRQEVKGLVLKNCLLKKVQTWQAQYNFLAAAIGKKP
jgi:hypothetical protein